MALLRIFITIIHLVSVPQGDKVMCFVLTSETAS